MEWLEDTMLRKSYCHVNRKTRAWNEVVSIPKSNGKIKKMLIKQQYKMY